MMYFIINIRIWNNQILSLNVYLCWFASLEVRTIFPHCYKSDLLILYLWLHRTFQECNTVVIIYLALKDIFNPLFVFSTKCRKKKPDLLPLYNNENSLILLLSIMVTLAYYVSILDEILFRYRYGNGSCMILTHVPI